MADIATVTMGSGLGAKARVGPVQSGLIVQFDGLGLRGGTMFDRERNEYGIGFSVPCDFAGVVVGAEGFDTPHDNTDLRDKEFDAISYGPFWMNARTKDHRIAKAYYTQIELVAAVGLSARVGVNPGEALDFVLGWLGIDIYGDDLDQRAAREEREKEPPTVDPSAPAASS